jgi:hypothetical protein
MSGLLTQYHARFATEGALLYRGARQFELGDPGSAVLAAAPTSEWMAQALGFAAPATFNKNVAAGAPQEQAARTALSVVLGTSARIGLDGARTTILESIKSDDKPVRFYRITDDDPCAFCALMSSRGAVYRSAESAGQMNDWHNDCGCSVAPAFTTNRKLQDTALEAQRIYRDLPNMPNPKRLAAFRKAWRERPRTADENVAA